MFPRVRPPFSSPLVTPPSRFAMQAFRTLLFTAKGLRRFLRDGYELHSKRFDSNDLEVDLTGRHGIVTGANQARPPR